MTLLARPSLRGVCGTPFGAIAHEMAGEWICDACHDAWAAALGGEG